MDEQTQESFESAKQLFHEMDIVNGCEMGLAIDALKTYIEMQEDVVEPNPNGCLILRCIHEYMKISRDKMERHCAGGETFMTNLLTVKTD